MIEIRNRYTGAVILSLDLADLRRADLTGAVLTGAVLTGADLRRADLRRADLTGAVLTGADLRRADLRRADLTGAVLRRAVLTGADLTGADLTGADLTGADLTGAVLRRADLTGADLTGAVLRRADLTGADLTGADLAPIRDDVFAVLSASPQEASGLRLALVEGRVDGSAYEGDCACLVGTLANLRHCNYAAIPGLVPNANRPAERFFLAIQRGDTPETNPIAAIVLGWVDEFLAQSQSSSPVVA